MGEKKLRTQIFEPINVWTVTSFFVIYFILLYIAFHYDLLTERPESPPSPPNTATTSTSDSKIQFTLEHAFGDSYFSDAGNVSAHLVTWSDGAQSLTKLLLTRDSFTDDDKNKFQELLEGDDFYRIRLPSNVLSPTGRQYIVSSVKARCLPGDSLEEHFAIHMDGVNILAVNYGAPKGCPYPRQLKLPAKWTFKSHMLLENTEHAPRTPIFTEEVPGGEGMYVGLVTDAAGLIFEYWMYLITLGLVALSVVIQAVNRPKGMTVWQAWAHPKAETAREKELLSMRNYFLTSMKNDILEILEISA